ncbi:MAG: DUF2961 domain-containing protein [Anaerolineaceae bacterium]|nr:DUF2961 domain-containing protein [Anaerolineaceae bacterium]
MSDFKDSPLGNLARLRNVSTRRISSWDSSGGNRDFIVVQPGETVVLADIDGAGCVNHIWCTHACTQTDYLRRLIFQARWDNEQMLSVNVPIGDFFGIGHAKSVDFVSLPIQRSPDNGRSSNMWFPMPYSIRAEFFLKNEADVPINFYYYIDYEVHGSIPGDMGRFHAQWNRENPTQGVKMDNLPDLRKEIIEEWGENNALIQNGPEEMIDNLAFSFGGKNIGGKENYTILEAEGMGHYVGCNFNIHNLRKDSNLEWPIDKPWPISPEDSQQASTEDKIAYLSRFNWYGEGDDMIFIDGDEWPPSMHGTGTEDYFNTAYCPATKYDSPYHGIILPGGPNWSGKISYYRFHIEDPIHFRKNIKVSIEHGHNNHRSDDISSTAYWYQKEPHMEMQALPPVDLRLPLPDDEEIK